VAWRASSHPKRLERVRSFLKQSRSRGSVSGRQVVVPREAHRIPRDVVKAMENPKLDVRMYPPTPPPWHGSTDRSQRSGPGQLLREAPGRRHGAVGVASSASRQVPSSHPKLTVNLLGRLLAETGRCPEARAVRALAEHPNPKRSGPLLDCYITEVTPIFEVRNPRPE